MTRCCAGVISIVVASEGGAHDVGSTKEVYEFAVCSSHNFTHQHVIVLCRPTNTYALPDIGVRVHGIRPLNFPHSSVELNGCSLLVAFLKKRLIADPPH